MPFQRERRCLACLTYCPSQMSGDRQGKACTHFAHKQPGHFRLAQRNSGERLLHLLVGACVMAQRCDYLHKRGVRNNALTPFDIAPSARNAAGLGKIMEKSDWSILASWRCDNDVSASLLACIRV